MVNKLGVHWVQSPRSVAKFLHVVMMTLSNLGDPETAILLCDYQCHAPLSPGGAGWGQGGDLTNLLFKYPQSGGVLLIQMQSNAQKFANRRHDRQLVPIISTQNSCYVLVSAEVK